MRDYCIFCGNLLDATFIGAGDGTGERFSHESCYLEKIEKLEAMKA